MLLRTYRFDRLQAVWRGVLGKQRAARQRARHDAEASEPYATTLIETLAVDWNGNAPFKFF